MDAPQSRHVEVVCMCVCVCEVVKASTCIAPSFAKCVKSLTSVIILYNVEKVQLIRYKMMMSCLHIYLLSILVKYY